MASREPPPCPGPGWQRVASEVVAVLSDATELDLAINNDLNNYKLWMLRPHAYCALVTLGACVRSQDDLAWLQ